ncbi:hypothetical protein SAMN05216196_101121 [Lutimaribacter pacificus]|uniref:Lipase (Class 3) n=1 Tax=Lutimaribacter pacificus TaxID=391948 RepID=A0A1H0AFP1_9RHOB|nr:hypothetical protein [Lutimaribacter pacificus]SDN31616.1 hypothetical protein SAMN05216196_101121 [Lutimaribacter pacificus]SHJ70603.1 hypothetical protein SAMN05444142_1011096 [Lutimaribacter pacificus]
MSGSDFQDKRRRRVFYIPGYDPIHPRRYRELYRKEGRDQAAITGYDLTLSPGKGDSGRYGWHVETLVDGARTDTDVEVLVWSDIVRDSMSNSIPATYLQLLRTAWAYIGSGALWRLMRLRKGPVIAALYPIVMLLAQLALALLAGWLLWRAAGLLTPWLGVAAQGIGALAGIALAVLVLRWFRARDNRLYAYYLMHDFAYSAQARGANPPELEARMAEFADTVAAALQTDVDEVLVVGHSSGAHLGVSILADLIRDGRVPPDGPALAFLSLGQVVPMVSFLPDAWRLRRDLAYLAQSDRLTWVDVTAPGDGCAFALCDPVAVSGVAPQDKRWPLVFSAAFTQTLGPERLAALKRRYFRLHFQYLCAFDRPKDYDYFLITAGPVTLADRYRGRPASVSRIERAVSGHVGVTP